MRKEEGKRGRGRPQTLNREHTVEVAMTSLWCDGVRDVSINEICRRANVSKPGAYREFGNEDGLMEAVVDLYRATVVAPLVEVLALDKPFSAVLDIVLHAVTEPSGKPAGCLVAELRSAPGRLGPPPPQRAARASGRCGQRTSSGFGEHNRGARWMVRSHPFSRRTSSRRS